MNTWHLLSLSFIYLNNISQLWQVERSSGVQEFRQHFRSSKNTKEGAKRQGTQQYCAFASRRDIYQYVHSHEEVLDRYADRMVMCERMPELFSAAMGQQMYTVKLQTMEEVNDFVSFVHDKQL